MNAPNETLKGELPDEELRRLLVPPDLPEGDRSGAVAAKVNKGQLGAEQRGGGTRGVPVGLLDTTSGGGTIASSLGRQLLSRSLSASRLACGLLRSEGAGQPQRVGQIRGEGTYLGASHVEG